MLLKELTTYFDKLFKKKLALSWDNTGLLIGDLNKEISGIMVTLDADSAAIKQAKQKKVDLIFSHHPLIFNPVKRLTTEQENEKIIMDFIKNDIALYSAHTNMDVADFGIGARLLEELGLEPAGSLQTVTDDWYKFVVFVPLEYEIKIRDKMCSAGGGNWKAYSCCTFGTKGKGTFMPGHNSRPFIGNKNVLSEVNEIRLECVVSGQDLDGLVENVLKAHPYEEPAYDIYPLVNQFSEGEIGNIGEYKKPVSALNFLKEVKEKLRIKNFRFVLDKSIEDIKIKRVLLINGSAGSVIKSMTKHDFDALLCGELDYHNCALLFDKGKLVIEAGHGESEAIFTDIVLEMLKRFNKENNLNLALYKSDRQKNLWRYFIE